MLFPVSLVVALVAALLVHRQKSHSPRTDDVTTTAPAQTKDDNNRKALSALQQARKIVPPVVALQKGGEFEHGEWWGDRDATLKKAWDEWWDQSRGSLPALTHETTMDPELREAVEAVRRDPNKETESKVRDRFETVFPKQVYKTPFFTPKGVQQIRQHLDAASYYYNNDDNKNSSLSAGIPTRRPNGMNRYGIILDPSIEGAVSYEGINAYITDLVAGYVRPLARMLFPEMASRNNPEDDEESYAFTVRYRSDLDTQLAEHSDASVYTININLNLPSSTDDDAYSGSSLYFVDPLTDTEHHVSFAPGMAVVHRGQTRHAALPITKGERHNLVVWLFGRHAYVRIAEYNKMERLTPKERWL